MRELKKGNISLGIVGSKLENQTYSDGTRMCVGDIVSLDGYSGVNRYSEVYVINNHPNGLCLDFTKGESCNWKCELVKRYDDVETGYICEGIEMVETSLTTIEMLKELTENPDKVFEATGASGKPVYVRMAEVYQGASQRVLIKTNCYYDESLELTNVTLNYKWTEFIEKEYTFEEAFNECKNNGTKFYREYRHCPNDEMSRFDGEVALSFNEEMSAICLTNRKWKREGN